MDRIRPAAAAARFGLHRSTLSLWAKRGVISRTVVEGCVWVDADEIETLLARNTIPAKATGSSRRPMRPAYGNVTPIEDRWTRRARERAERERAAR